MGGVGDGVYCTGLGLLEAREKCSEDLLHWEHKDNFCLSFIRVLFSFDCTYLGRLAIAIIIILVYMLGKAPYYYDYILVCTVLHDTF